MKITARHVGTFLVGLLFVLPFGISLLGAFAPFVPVDTVPLLQMLPPVLGWLALVHLIGVLFFLRRSRRLLLMALVGLGCAAWAISQDIRLASSGHAMVAPDDEIRVVTFNVETFQYKPEQVDEVTLALQPLRPDIVAMQEFRHFNNGRAGDALAHISAELGLPHYRFDHRPENIHGGTIFSRWPIVSVDTLYMEPAEINTGILVTIQTPAGPIGLANVHLTSYSLKRKVGEAKELPRTEKVPSLYRHGIEIVYDQQRKVDQILTQTAAYPHPLVIVGDFNSAPHSRIIHQFQARYQDSFLEAGEGIGWTYPMLGPLGFRIDYQFASDEWHIVDHQVVREGISDHYPVLATYARHPDSP